MAFQKLLIQIEQEYRLKPLIVAGLKEKIIANELLTSPEQQTIDAKTRELPEEITSKV